MKIMDAHQIMNALCQIGSDENKISNGNVHSNPFEKMTVDCPFDIMND